MMESCLVPEEVPAVERLRLRIEPTDMPLYHPSNRQSCFAILSSPSIGALWLCLVGACAAAAELPAVQCLLPGFTVQRLPVELSNINELAYRSDGVLVAVGFDGRMYLLRDRDGDGLEEEVTCIWDQPRTAPLGLVVEADRYLIVARGQVVALRDRDGDERIDEEQVLAQGWPPPSPVTGGGVDALGLAVARDGSIYFGLGTEDYSNAYLVRDGQSQFRLDTVRGTIQRIDPQSGQREAVCSGVRFPVGLAFNRHGDLFCTDQEGATWLPNGNPLDELLHIQPHRHYGFPPAHPRFLPDVIDEPSTFDFAPQHQSTCGLIFNDGVFGGPSFGPAHWQGDALVAGYSRGKLYRVKLVKGENGYVAHGELFACLQQLTLEPCLSPQGDLLVATHSGGPDWGSGPAGPGSIWKIRYTDPSQPQPLAVWSSGPHELRVAFDRPLELEALRGAQLLSTFETGAAVSAGDQFETLRPGYQVVQDQVQAPRNHSKVQALALTSDQQTLVLTIQRWTDGTRGALRLPLLHSASLGPAVSDPSSTVEQVPQIDLGASLHGVSAGWRPATADPSSEALRGLDLTWQTWLPTLDLGVARELLAGSSEFQALQQRLTQPGELELQTQLDLWQFLQPAIQPGARLDYERPSEQVTVRLRAPAGTKLEVRQLGASPPLPVTAIEPNVWDWKCEPISGQPLTVKLILPTPFPNVASTSPSAADETANADGTKAAGTTTPYGVALLTSDRGIVRGPIAIAAATDRDPRWRAIQLHRFWLPGVTHEWATRAVPGATGEREIAELAGADWHRGRLEFFSKDANCSACHRMRGEGALIGPDLSNLTSRDYGSVLRDVSMPSYAINPDFGSHLITTRDGRVLTGRLMPDAPGDRLRIADQKGEVVELTRDEIESLQPAAQSLMPEGLVATLGAARIRDLLAFLLLPPPATRMPDYGGMTPPPARTDEELSALLADSESLPAADQLKEMKIVLVAGPKDHGPGEHDYPAWQAAWHEWLRQGPKVTVETAWEWPSAAQLAWADVLVFYKRGQWTAERLAELDQFYARDGGVVVIHWGVEGSPDLLQTAMRIGLVSEAGKIKYRHGPIELDFSPGAGEPIVRNLTQVAMHDETYWHMIGDANRIRVLATAIEDGQAWPMLWTYHPPAGGRAFVSIPGHYAWSFDDPVFRTILLRGISWAAGQSVDRLNPLLLEQDPPTR
jgi:putative heme-binding domain-containing protein